ncbi:MAG: methionine--tRNA ligase [Pseudomonadota bacterium]
MTQRLTDKENILITSALPYINGIKHLGNLIGSMLPADLYARYMRLKGKNVLYICATDEHGTPAELAALEQNKEVAQYCSEMHDLQKILGEGFDLSWDYFGRSSSEQNRELTQYFHNKLSENDLIYEQLTRQIYSVDDERFLPDRYVTGTCPHCGYDRARGDQCENCTRVLDPTELISPRSSISGSKNIEVRSSKHLFLKQSDCEGILRDWIEQKKSEGWPLLVSSIAEKWLDEGLLDRCITRDLKWGIPVNREGFEDKVFYVWFDAPIAYIAATKEKTDADNLDDKAWQKWWKTDQGADDVFYIQFMAKDNVPFHTVSFPVTLFGSNDNWKSADYIKGFNWLTYYGGKFSTSSKRGVFMNQALEIYPSDYWRWYLLSNAPESADSAFTWEAFQIAINKDLADVLGNFINRVTKFCASKFGDRLPSGGELTDTEHKATKHIQGLIKNYISYMDNVDIRKAAQELRGIWVAGNEYLQEAAPWTAFKTNPEQAGASIRYAFSLIALFAELSKPFIPQKAEMMTRIIDVDHQDIWQDQDIDIHRAQADMRFTMPDILFSKIDDEDIVKLKERFGGEEPKESEEAA